MSCDSPQFRCICKKEALIITDDNDELPISNIGALIKGFQAMEKEDASDNARAKELWQDAKDSLADETQDDEGAGATGVVQVSDDFDCASIGGNFYSP